MKQVISSKTKCLCFSFTIKPTTDGFTISNQNFIILDNKLKILKFWIVKICWWSSRWLKNCQGRCFFGGGWKLKMFSFRSTSELSNNFILLPKNLAVFGLCYKFISSLNFVQSILLRKGHKNEEEFTKSNEKHQFPFHIKVSPFSVLCAHERACKHA